MATDYLAQARDHLSKKYGNDVSILKKSIVDSDRFYCFTFQSNEFIKTGNYGAMLVGQGYTIINKQDNRIFDFGSRHALKESIKILDERLRLEQSIRKHKPQFALGIRYDLRVTEVRKLQLLVDALREAAITYIIPEVVGDSIFRISKAYNVQQLMTTLKDLPAIFHGIPNGLMLIHTLLTLNCCDIDLLIHEEKSLAKYSDKATEDDLKPIW